MATTDHVALALSRLPEQMKGLPKWEALVTAFAQQLAEIETAFQDVLTLRSISDATGAQLDTIGDIVGQTRNGVADDDLYRRRVRARIAVNRSKGTPRDLISIGRLVVDAGVTVEVVQQQVATAVVRVLDTSDDVADIFVEYLRDAVAAGVRLLLEYSPHSAAEVFTFPIVGFLEEQADAGEDVLVMGEVDGYLFRRGQSIPDSGWVDVVGQAIVDPDGVAEAVTYYRVTHDTLFLTAPLSGTHIIGTTVLEANTTLDIPDFHFTTAQTFEIDDEFDGGVNTSITVAAGTYTHTTLAATITAQLPPAGAALWSFTITPNGDVFDSSFAETEGEFYVYWLTATDLRDALGYTGDSGPIAGNVGETYDATSPYPLGYFAGVLE